MKSVREQSLSDWEHIVVDDCSDDGTDEEVLRCAAADPRVRYLRRESPLGGANLCRNQGIAAASAPLIVFLDSDDLLDPICLERRVALMQRNEDIDFAVWRMGAFLSRPGDLGKEQSADLIGDDLLLFLFFECPWQTTGPIWRRAALRRLGGFDENLPSWQDVDLHVRAITAGLLYLRVPELDYHMRWQVSAEKVSTLQRKSPEHLRAAERLFEKFETIVRKSPGMTWSRQRALCSLYFTVAEFWLAAGLPREALRCWGAVRRRELGSRGLHYSGAVVLSLLALGSIGQRIGKRLGHKWKGWVRFRSEPELVRL